MLSVDWEVVESSPGNLLTSNSAGGAKNATQTLNFPGATTLTNFAPATVTVNAYVNYSDRVVKVSKTVKIQNAACCEGTIVYSGNLCWYKTDAPKSSKWNPDSGCATGYRWPTIDEWRYTWVALGNSRYFGNIGTRGEMVEQTIDFSLWYYWSTTPLSAGWWYGWDASDDYWGEVSMREDNDYNNVRCVRSL
jgi:hypothetical protein